MVLSLEALSEKINRLRVKSGKNKGRLMQIKEEKKRISTTLKEDFNVKNIDAAKELLEENYDKLREQEEVLQETIGRLDNFMERDLS